MYDSSGLRRDFLASNMLVTKTQQTLNRGSWVSVSIGSAYQLSVVLPRECYFSRRPVPCVSRGGGGVVVDGRRPQLLCLCSRRQFCAAVGFRCRGFGFCLEHGDRDDLVSAPKWNKNVCAESFGFVLSACLFVLAFQAREGRAGFSPVSLGCGGFLRFRLPFFIFWRCAEVSVLCAVFLPLHLSHNQSITNSNDEEDDNNNNNV